MRLLLVFLTIAQSVHAGVLVQGPTAPALEYRAALKADPDVASPTQYLLRQRPSGGRRELLLSAFASAQKAFLENSTDEAIVKFQTVVAMLAGDDWSRNDRQVFVHSYLRLAQMQGEIEKQNMWLSRALAAGDDVEPEAGLFPPPLLRALSGLRQEVPRALVPANLFTEGWTTVLLNGIPCAKPNCAGYPISGEKIRVTFLSDIWQTVTLILDAEALKSVKPVKIPWAAGDCAKTQLSRASAGLKEPKVFWGLSCEPLPDPALNLNPVARMEALPVTEIKGGPPAFYKSKWFWGGIAAAAAAALIINSQKRHDEEKVPSTTYGHQ